jgi:carbonic anhydrase/acetyltransferase-like protein (isoleucine patch superfamily)
MISYKQLKKRSKKKKLKKCSIKQFCKVLLVASCGFVPFNQSFAQTGNTLYGTNAGASISSADSIVAIGVNAGRLTTFGARHVIIGTNAGYNLNYNPTNPLGNITTSSFGSSVHIGYYAGYHTSSARNNVFIGGQSGYRNTTGQDNVFIGTTSGMSNTTGTENVFIGSQAGTSNTTGARNVFIGKNSGYDNTTGIKNTFVGRYSGHNNTTGYQNTFLGNVAGEENTTGHHNTALGDSTLQDNSLGYYNTSVGAAAGAGSEYASYNTFVGAYSGWFNNRNNSLTTSVRNTYLGAFTGYNNIIGSDNTGIGTRADFVQAVGSLTDFNNTVFIGSYASVNANGVTIIGKSSSGSGTNGIAIGLESSVSASNAIAIGYQASATTANEVVIGNATHTTIGGAVNWTATSDGRFKTAVKENVVGLDFINQLRPVTYLFDTKKIIEHKGQNITEDLYSALEAKDTIRYTGFIAQEVEQAAINSNFNFSGVDKPTQNSKLETQNSDYYGLRYAEFVVPLVKATQELSQKVEALEKKNQAQQDLLAKYEAALENALIQIEALKSEKNEVVNQ